MKDDHPVQRALLHSLQMVAMVLAAFVCVNMAIDNPPPTPTPVACSENPK
jgi:hypothetical protein